MLAVLLYHGIRREELCRLKVGDIQSRQGVLHLRIAGKREKIRYIPLAIAAQRLITTYLDAAKHGEEMDGPLFRPVKNNTSKTLAKALHTSSVWDMVRLYTKQIGIAGTTPRLGVHAIRGNSRHQCPGARRRHRQGAGVAGACGYLHHAALRQARQPAGGQPDLQGAL